MGSVQSQTVVPLEVIVIDASDLSIGDEYFENELIRYFHVSGEDRGLTRQRNLGLSEVSQNADIVSFIDDDVILKDDYFENKINTFRKYPLCAGLGGIDLETNSFVPVNGNEKDFDEIIDGWGRIWPLRYKLRKALGLMNSSDQPGKVTSYMHARDMLPPSGKVYSVDHLVGCTMSFRINHIEKQYFSEFFHGYGHYEDFDFSFRCKEAGWELLIDTSVHLRHYHSPQGRPNRFNYGRMVIRNGKYIWKKVNKNPGFKDRLKWFAISILNIVLPILSSRTTLEFQQNISDGLGRIYELIISVRK